MGFFDELVADSKMGLMKGNTDFWDAETIPCGVPPIDHILGGGVGLGRVMEMFGNEASGKSLLLYKFLIENSKRGGTSILIETEGAFNPEFFASLGGDPSQLLIDPLETVEDVFDRVVELCKKRSKAKSKDPKDNVVIGWDSVAATATKHLLQVGMEKKDMSKAEAMSRGCSLVTQLLKDTSIALICINQIREKVGEKYPTTTTPGGKALGFYASQRLSLYYSEANKYRIFEVPGDDATEEDKLDPQQIGRVVVCRTVKNRLGGAWRECKLPFYSYDNVPHPVFEDRMTAVGVDIDESLLMFYLDAYFFLPNGARVVQRSSPGWYQLDVSIDPQQAKWRKKEWPTLLEVKPELRDLVYAAPQAPSSANVQQLPPLPPSSDS